MDAAKAAVNKITGRTGHKTDVDETVNPAVTSETVKPHRHEETTEAVNREIHQDHYHTTVQPISHQERLPEKHTHNLAPQVEREFHHGNDGEVRQGVSTELGQFQDTSKTHQATHSTAAAPAVAGEHVHHHVHETVQPVIHKETVQPEVVHTTVPIHETHTAAAQHHSMSALPAKTLHEFERAGGSLTGSQRTAHEEYEGRPRPYNEQLTADVEKVLPGSHHSSNVAGTGSNVGGTGTTRDTVGGTTGAGVGSTTHSGLDNTTRGGVSDTTGTGVGSTTHSGLGDTTRDTVGGTTGTGTHSGLGNTARDTVGGTTGTHSGLGNTGDRFDNTTTGTTGTTGTHQTSSGRDTIGRDEDSTGNTHKPSLMDRLNPRKDADGDGKPGFMS